MIKLRSPLAALATRILWARIEAVLTPAACVGSPKSRGTTCARNLALGASTPWKRIRCSLGLGTSAASHCMNFQRRPQQVRGAVWPGGLELEHHLPGGVGLHALVGQSGARDVVWLGALIVASIAGHRYHGRCRANRARRRGASSGPFEGIGHRPVCDAQRQGLAAPPIQRERMNKNA